ncbi:hypothetical protein BS333_06515 [Vibrio azureus]|uniref:Outer membrane protein beta-barrel domain-containing protein n=1 Tax=Vibrio azureus NBRC 104587 TaxID=1219077 RepID=U3A3U6_9VIBR|nr:outer membrane beta-barrel protein [Vibrio azureus]AUI87387.1 hypothetical protein BS333_06515 [Vibrio azureus]GAD74681.1 hypothetical protein VAZ01S_013_00890 [Vibrio azureus NBRC 104587]
MKGRISLLALALWASPVLADSWLYAGGQIGQARVDGESDLTYGLHVGTGIMPLIGLEFGYFRHGNMDFTFHGLNGNADLASYYAAVKPSMNFGPLHLYAKGGINSYNIDYKGDISYLYKDDGISYMFGLGLEYLVLKNLSVGAGYQVFGLEMNKKSEFLHSLTANITFHFF